MKRNKTQFISVVTLVTILLSTVSALPASAVNRVSYVGVPSTAQNAGESFTAIFQLDEPIICADTYTALTIQLASSDTSTAFISQNNLTWNANQWAETRTITVNVSQSLTYDSSSSVRFRGTVQSNSEYYRNYQVTLTVAINAPIKPISIPDPKQLSMITEKPANMLSDTATTIVNFKGKFVEDVKSIYVNGLRLPTEAWTQSDTLISLKVPPTSRDNASIQIYNGAIPILFDGTLEVLRSKTNVEELKRSKIRCKGKKVSRTIYGLAPTCPIGFSLVK